MKKLRTLLAAVLFGSTLGALAQAPGNDLFANRYVITGLSVSTIARRAGIGYTLRSFLCVRVDLTSLLLSVNGILQSAARLLHALGTHL